MAEKKYPELPIEVLLTALMDYNHVIADTAKDYPDDKDVQEMKVQYENCFNAFQKTVEGGKWNSSGKDEVQTIIDIFEALNPETAACLLSGIGYYIDILTESVAGSKDADQQTLNFYESIVNLFNDIAAIFTELDSSYTYKDLITDMVADGYGRNSGHKVIFDSFQEQLAALEEDPSKIGYALKFFEGLNMVEKDYFSANFVPEYIVNTENALERLEQNGETPENMTRMINSVVAAKKLNRELICNAK